MFEDIFKLISEIYKNVVCEETYEEIYYQTVMEIILSKLLDNKEYILIISLNSDKYHI